MDEELKIGKLVFGKQYGEPHGLEITAEVRQYSDFGSYTEDVYFFLNRQEVENLRDYLDRLLKIG
jgi:hypothetical protein